MYHIKECIIVEGVYDKIKLSRFIDATIFVTHGFSVFNNKKAIKTIKTLAEKCGVVILTDSDAAGFKIRNFIKQSLPEAEVKHAYIPEVQGKERRKKKAGKEGILGVEGISEEIILNALKNAGCTIDSEPAAGKKGAVTKADLYNLGLSGGAQSSAKRQLLGEKLGLPSKISANMFTDAVNAIMSREEFFEFCKNESR